MLDLALGLTWPGSNHQLHALLPTSRCCGKLSLAFLGEASGLASGSLNERPPASSLAPKYNTVRVKMGPSLAEELDRLEGEVTLPSAEARSLQRQASKISS